MKILLIDDDEWIRDSMSLFFEEEDCKLLTFETAEEGLNELKKHDFDIIFSDYRLPGMNGLEFFRRIKQISHYSIKILITAYGKEEIFLKAKQIGVHDIIEKPFTTENIEASLSLLVQKIDF